AQTIEDVVIELSRGAVVTGTVMDDGGEPIVGASVMVERPAAVGVRTPRLGLTDDLGRYRVAGLPEGPVRVSIFQSPRDIVMLPDGLGVITNAPGATRAGDRIYYPGVPKADQAGLLQLQPGDERRAIDFVVAARLPLLPPSSQFRHDDESSII